MPAMPASVNRRHVERQNHPIADVLDRMLIAGARDAIETGTPVKLAHPIRSRDRATGAMLSGEIARRHGHQGLADDTVHVSLTGTAGQSFGAWLAAGVTLDLVGEANDYVGKGLSGGKLIIRPAENAAAVPEKSIIVGNTVLYGAIAGECYFRGVAGERFAVRNSGATAVIEGCGANGCEYMTGGAAVILGEVGENFGAGMTGGMAFAYDPDGRFPVMANPDTILWRRIGAAAWETQLRALIEEHVERTGSVRGRLILASWTEARGQFWQIVPKEMVGRLASPLDDEAAVAAE
jgi:glutamate synthase (NADPH/NADH) large chain